MIDAPTANDATFKADLVLLIPHLRAFAGGLAGRAFADDLAQETMLKAWRYRSNYQPGTNLKAWLFTILRNQFLSEKRRSWRTQPLDPVVAENTLVANNDPTTNEELLDVRNAIQLLPEEQRVALLLAGPAGLSYEETAKICGCALGTVKSRVSRARVALADILARKTRGQRMRTEVSAAGAFDDIMQHAARLLPAIATAA